MTLEEALSQYDYVEDPTDPDKHRVAGRDPGAAVVVEITSGGTGDRYKCYLWCGKTGERLGDIEVLVNDADGIGNAVERLLEARERAGDCPICGLPLGVMADGTGECPNCEISIVIE